MKNLERSRYMMVIQDTEAAPQDVKNLEPLADDKSESLSISPSHKSENNDNHVERSVSETKPMASDKVLETETSNQELQDDGGGDGIFLGKSEVPISSLENETEIKIQDKAEIVEMSNLSSPLEQIDTVLESSVKADVLSEKDQDLVEDGDLPKMDSLKTSTNSENVRDDDRSNGVECNEPSGDATHLSKVSVNNKTSDMELNFVMIDPLEVARQVAMEAERNTDSRERSCSTSDKMTDSKNGQECPSQPNGQECQSQPLVVKNAEIPVSQISEVAQESDADTSKGFAGFDLNQEVCSEEVDNPVNPVSSTISIASASRASAASGLPSAPLQFEGVLGWKGSTSTSSSKPIPDGTHKNSNQRMDCSDFDLNAADGNEDKTLPSGEESSVEANGRGGIRIQFDLNSSMDEGCDGHTASVNKARCPSPSRSYSSSSKQPPLKNIDLNLNDHQDSFISIFGSKLGVKKNDLCPTVDFNLGRPVSSIHYGHNGFTPGPAMFFPTPMYGGPQGMPVPYMVDSRGSTIVPQIMGSSLTPSIAFPQQPSPFIMNMAGAGSSGAGPSYQNFDLNTGITINGGNRENTGGLRQFFPQNGNEQYLTANNASSSIVGGKRHEPDSGWDLFPVNKHQQPPWR